MPTLELLPSHQLKAIAERERRAADALDLDAMSHHRACCRIVAILAARRAGIAREVRALRLGNLGGGGPGRLAQGDHDETDGTVDCLGCGITAGEFITAAGEWLQDHDGETADDPGYFS